MYLSAVGCAVWVDKAAATVAIVMVAAQYPGERPVCVGLYSGRGRTMEQWKLFERHDSAVS
jgi:hypothetical protein